MQKYEVWLNIAVLAGMLASLPALAEEKPKYKSSIQVSESKEGTEKSEQPKLQKLARISQQAAAKTALGKATGAKYLRTQLENEDGNLVYVVEFSVGKQEREIVIDAGTGKILADYIEKPETKDKDE